MSETKTCRMCGMTAEIKNLPGQENLCWHCVKERRVAWDKFAAACLAEPPRIREDILWWADALLADRDARFCQKKEA